MGPSFYLQGDFDGINGSPSRGVAYLGYYDANEQFDPRFVNVAVRAQAGGGEQQPIVGFVARGSFSSRVLVRALGPALSNFGVAGGLADPRLQLRAGADLVTENDDWPMSIASTFAAAGAFPLTAGSADAAADPVLAPRDYTLAIGGAGGGTGIVLGEVYRSPATNAMTVGEFRMFNVSARALVGSGEKALIAGFALRGNGTRRVLVRGVGPALVTYGVTEVLSRPLLRVYAGDELIGESRQWDTDARIAEAAARAGAFPLVAGSRDTAVLIDLPPGEYTAMISGEDGATGIALVEVYEVK